MVVPMPPNVSFEEASTIPTVFTTVHIAFKVASNLKKGEKVLIHASAGGVGLAAVQMARSLGAVVVSTAGGPNKRSLLHNLGVNHVIGSRDTVFSEELAILGGVDVILNSLTSSGMLGASISSLNKGGRLVEISKRDIWSPARVFEERPDIGYSILAVDFLPPSVLNSTLEVISHQLATGELMPLRQISHTMGAVANAMRQLSQASHVGKVVCTTRKGGDSIEVQPSSLTMTGGVGGLGLIISDWLCGSYESMHLTLLGRSGMVVNQPSSWRGLLETNSQVTIVMANVSSFEESSCLLKELSRSTKNFVHASGVLRDSLLERQSSSSFRQTYAPKIPILQHCHSCYPFENITLFSSVASLLGGAGQGNYASANAYLDGWAFEFQKAGVNSRSVQWGAWASSGMASEAVLRRLERIGQGMITADQGLASLGCILRLSTGSLMQPYPLLAVNSFDWATYLKDKVPPIFSEFSGHGALSFRKQVIRISLTLLFPLQR